MDVLEARVKLFVLDSENKWDDLGIFVARSDVQHLEFFTEDTFEYFDGFKIESEQLFRQNQSVICLSDGKAKKYALSFQLAENAESFWSFLTQKEPENIFPFPSANNLSKIIEILMNFDDFSIISEEWLDSLCQSVLSNSDEQDLHSIYFDIFQILVSSKTFTIIEGLLKSNSFQAVFFLLEKDSKKSFSLNFFDFFQEKVKFFNFLSIENQKMIQDIHVAYRVLCLKDSLLSRSFNDETVAFLKVLYCKKWDEILTEFKNSPTLILELMKKLMMNEENAFLFIREIIKNCHFVNSLTRAAVFDCFKSANYLKYMLVSWSLNPKVEFADVLLETLKIMTKDDPKVVFALFSSSWQEFLNLIFFSVNHLSSTFELLSDLVNSDFLQADSHFFNLFSEKILPFFIEELSRSDLLVNFEYFQGILRLFSACLRSGICNFRYILMSRDLNNLLLNIFQTRSKLMVVEVVQVVSAEVDNNNEFFIINLIKSGVLLKVFEAFIENANKENLVFSSIFSLIKKILNSGNEELTGFFEELASLKRFELLKKHFFWYFQAKEANDAKFSPDSEMSESLCNDIEKISSPVAGLIETEVKTVKIINDDHPKKKQKYEKIASFS